MKGRHIRLAGAAIVVVFGMGLVSVWMIDRSGDEMNEQHPAELSTPEVPVSPTATPDPLRSFGPTTPMEPTPIPPGTRPGITIPPQPQPTPVTR